ncbi:MAG: hypothetical protein IPO67_29530 [Deltaproteobacteria bacterium]|nr:hypothetical protein [Deltaproteobacteria bacterium]
MMTRTLLTTLAALLLPSIALAEVPGNFGIGIGGGLGVSGLSMKAPIGPGAIQGVIGTYGWNGRYDDDRLGVSIDALWEQPTFASGGPVNLAWNIGFGGAVGVGQNDPLVGISGVAGLEFIVQPAPIDIVLEYRPGIILSPGVYSDLVNFSGHIRYYF